MKITNPRTHTPVTQYVDIFAALDFYCFVISCYVVRTACLYTHLLSRVINVLFRNYFYHTCMQSICSLVVGSVPLVPRSARAVMAPR